MTVTAEDIEAEHKAALEALTREQHLALGRIQRAIQMAHFNHHRMSENLQQIFREEARRRSEAEQQGGRDMIGDEDGRAQPPRKQTPIA